MDPAVRGVGEGLGELSRAAPPDTGAQRASEREAAQDRAAALLWEDTALYERRHRKSASALIAVQRAVDRAQEPGPGAREFLRLYDLAARAEAGPFTRVWTDPTAYWWVRMAYQLAATALGSAALSSAGRDYCRALGELEPAAALDHHLADFKRFALALHHQEGSDCEFDRALRVRLPFAIPASPLVLEGRGSVDIWGLQGGEVDLARNGKRLHLPLKPDVGGAIAVRECPVARYAGCAVRLQPAAFNNLPGVDFAPSAVESGAEFQSANAPRVVEALALMERYHPDGFDHFGRVMQLVALKQRQGGSFSNISYSDMPGAFLATAEQHPFELTDVFIHEFHHNRLFFVEEAGAFFDLARQDPLADERYYMPWRPDLRPVHGILHGIYVYIAVSRYWRNVVDEGGLEGTDLDFARDRALRGPLQLSIAVHQLRRHGCFTTFGRALFDEMARASEALLDRVAADGPAVQCLEDGSLRREIDAAHGRPIGVRESLRRHLREHAPDDQYADVTANVRFD